MTDPSSPTVGGQAAGFSVRRLCPLVVIVLVIGVVYAMGWHRELSLETLVRHRVVIDEFVAEHRLAAVAAFIGLYITAAALSLPAGAVMTTIGGFLFGTVIGGLAAMLGATIGATIIFLIAKSAIGEHLVRRAGPRAAKFAEGFRADAFSYMLFLRLVPFPFWLVNLAPALFGVRLTTFVTATAIGIIPACFAFAFFGAGLGSAIAVQEQAYKACVAAGRTDCGVDLNPTAMLTPELLAALVVLGAVGLIPIVAKRIRNRGRAADRDQPTIAAKIGAGRADDC
jgi:uncharacterized membrane protein YdjX (TVP38/TMEM64 family)